MRKLVEGCRYVLSFEEKHDTRHFVVLNQAELEAAALKVLSNRLADGYWYRDPGNSKLPEPSYTAEQILFLKGPAKQAALDEIKLYQKRRREKDNDIELWDQIQKAINTKDGELAYSILDQRSNHQYEQMSLELAETI